MHAAPTLSILRPQTTGVHVLRHNDLTAEAATHPTSVLYLSTPRNFAEATVACLELKEDLAIEESAFLKDILVGTEPFNHQGTSFDQVWIGNGCQTYNLRTHTVGRTDCQTKLPAVCTNKTPAPIQVTGAKAFGTVIGTRDSNSFRFLGLPYALPPVGALRFRPPEPAPPAASHDARQYGAVCPQETGTDYRLNQVADSEDCLFLNVFTPSVKAVGEPSKLPVIVYIHGGGFKQYGGSNIFFEPGNLVSRGRVVVVTFNYRLGLLGLLENESIIPRSILPGNLFLRDQILALQWVQDNIAAFGGDPSNVTLMGESAGAVSIRALLVIPQAYGLYRNVISQSDVIGAPFHEASTTSGIMGQTAMNILQCVDLPCLQALPLKAIIEAQDQVIAHYYKVYVRSVLMLPFLPTVDHDLLPADFYALAQQGLVNPTPHILWGSTHDENGIVMPPQPVDFPQYHATMVQYFRDDRVALLENSPYYQPDWTDPDTVRVTVVKAAVDLYFYCPRFLLAKLLPPQQQQTLYTFRFNRGKPLASTPKDFCTMEGHVCHFADVVVSFGNAMGIPGLGQSEDDARFARQVVDRFVTFAKTGDPNPVVLRDDKGAVENVDVTSVQWEPFWAGNRPVLELALESHVSHNAGAEACKWVEAQHVISFESDYKHK
ncbi:hypothetical protein CPB97_004404 [Podila verticillata]|nr:hypothetical protein CPB97_004404 [Podila verticillata]